MNDIDVVYTMWSNLHKTDGMEVGQVGFHKQVQTRPNFRSSTSGHARQLNWGQCYDF
jgi:hypothetical protein